MNYDDKMFVDLFNKSNNIVFMTGAGVSTHSGIPDYRSANGLYSDNPEYMLSDKCLHNEYLKFLQFITEHFDVGSYEPNKIHKWIADLEKTGKNITVITQNIDNLHQKAGSTNVVPYHGNIDSWRCDGCFSDYDFNYVKEHNYCSKCGCKLTPNVVLYGQDINAHNASQAIESMTKADLVIVVGTSLAVSPFNSLLEWGYPLTKKVLINKTQTENYFSLFDLVFLEDAIDFINRIEDEIKYEQKI